MAKIQYPIEVNSVKFGDRSALSTDWHAERGSYVAVRPCSEKYENKTYVGIFLGTLALGQCIRYKEETKELTVEMSHYNPAIYVPEIKEIIFGCGSWWKVIDKPEDLEQISDNDIENVWYVKALKEIQKNKYE